MEILDNVSLAGYSTMGLGGPAVHLVHVMSKEELSEAVAWAHDHNMPTIMIGGGSNIFWRDEGFPGLVMVNRIAGYDISPLEDGSVLLKVGSGENWDAVVQRTVEAGLTGIEGLSLIPGSAGATPVQNVGAYGQEISQTLVEVEAFDTQRNNFVTIPGSECGFSYRTSRFKANDRGRFYIVSVTLRLHQGSLEPPFYHTLQSYIDEHQITEFAPHIIRDAVIAIRNSRLPDPVVVHNNGSFFGNPFISNEQLNRLLEQYPEMPHWPQANGEAKIHAAWLIEQAGFKDFHDQETGMATWPKQSLVFVNEHARSTADLLHFRQKILNAVQAKFDITLVQEPELLP